MAKLEQLLDNSTLDKRPIEVALFLLQFIDQDEIYEEGRDNPQSRIEEGLMCWGLAGNYDLEGRLLWERGWLDFVLRQKEEFVAQDDFYYWEHQTRLCGCIAGWCSCGSRGF